MDKAVCKGRTTVEGLCELVHISGRDPTQLSTINYTPDRIIMPSLADTTLVVANDAQMASIYRSMWTQWDKSRGVTPEVWESFAASVEIADRGLLSKQESTTIG